MQGSFLSLQEGEAFSLLLKFILAQSLVTVSQDDPDMPYTAVSCEEDGIFVCLAAIPDSAAHSSSAVIHCFLTQTDLSV